MAPEMRSEASSICSFKKGKIINMNNKTKSIIAIILSFAVIIGTLGISHILLIERSGHGIKQCLAMYKQPQNTVDVVMIGSSHVHCGINTAKLWKDYGIAGYDYSSAEQPLWISYHYLKEFCKYQEPKVVVLDFYSAAAFLDNYRDKYVFSDDQLYGFRFSLNKLQMMNVAFDGKIENWDRYFPAFAGFHDRYKNMELEDYKEAWTADYSSFKGYMPVFANYKSEKPVIGTDEMKAPSDKSAEYLRKIIDYTTENDIQLYITIVPYKVNTVMQEGITQEEEYRYNWLENYIAGLDGRASEMVRFDYTLKHLDDIGIDFESGRDIADGNSHLNYYGSIKFSEYLGENLRNTYGMKLLPDHRGEDAYISWDENVRAVESEVTDAGWEIR